MASPGSGPPVPGTDTHGRVTRFRIGLPHAGIVDTGHGHFEATEFAEKRMGWKGRYLDARDRVLGTTLTSTRLETERLSKIKALAVFSSDALSSVAYATQEILFVLVIAGPAAIKYSLPIAGFIALLLTIVIASYRQTVRAYPSGGGAYIVAHKNIGIGAGLIAASSLLIDYVLTVSVSVAAGIDALASLNEGFRPFAIPLALGLVAIVALINLRGVSESGTIFSIPTYAFIITLTVAITIAFVKIFSGGGNPLAAGTPDATQLTGPFEGLGLFLLLRAFSNGCAALTGVEAISNGVQAFKKPASKNASQTLLAMGLILGIMFVGMTIIARHYAFIPHEDNTIPAQLGAVAFGDGSPLFAFLQVMTAGILILAANTSFADFPRLAAILARDGYLPRVFHQRGNRLVFSYGIIVLAGLASLLLVLFDAKTTRLIPLYALGVFLSFTLSQSGMVKHWLETRERGWLRAAIVNGAGAIATALVFTVILSTKFLEGAWVVVILIPVLALIAWGIGRFYQKLARTLHVAPEAVLDIAPRGDSRRPIVVPVETLNLATVMTLGAACERSRDVTAVHVVVDPDEPSTVEEQWHSQFPNIPLVVIDSPYRTVADPIAAYVADRVRKAPYEVTVLVPLLQVRHFYQRPLVNQSLKRLTRLLRKRSHVEVVNYPFAATGAGRRRKAAPGVG
jgi:amino acid transporter